MPEAALKTQSQNQALAVANWRDAIEAAFGGMTRERNWLKGEFPGDKEKQKFTQRDVAAVWLDALNFLYHEVAELGNSLAAVQTQAARAEDDASQKRRFEQSAVGIRTLLGQALDTIRKIETTYPKELVSRLRRYFASGEELRNRVAQIQGDTTPTDQEDMTALFDENEGVEIEILRGLSYAITRRDLKGEIIGDSQLTDRVFQGKTYV